MTGENFLRIDRKSSRLEELKAKYNRLVDIACDVHHALAEGDAGFDDYYDALDKCKEVKEAIWREAFYHYGRDWNAANAYVNRYC